MAGIKDVSAVDMIENFGQYTDLDALSRLFCPRTNGAPRQETGYVALEIRGVHVRVHAEGVNELES